MIKKLFLVVRRNALNQKLVDHFVILNQRANIVDGVLLVALPKPPFVVRPRVVEQRIVIF